MELPGAREAVGMAFDGRVGGLDRAARRDPKVAALELEALFATLLVKELRRSLPDEGFFGDAPGADTFNAWMDEYVGRAVAATGSLKIAERVERAANDDAATRTDEVTTAIEQGASDARADGSAQRAVTEGIEPRANAAAEEGGSRWIRRA